MIFQYGWEPVKIQRILISFKAKLLHIAEGRAQPKLNPMWNTFKYLTRDVVLEMGRFPFLKMDQNSPPPLCRLIKYPSF